MGTTGCTRPLPKCHFYFFFLSHTLVLRAGHDNDVRSISSCTWSPMILKYKKTNFRKKNALFPKMKNTICIVGFYAFHNPW